ncbi:MAG: YCF48-related protein [Bacteroidota bacterium]|nr:YCF48-related protein [Bacteroidota bacterium]
MKKTVLAFVLLQISSAPLLTAQFHWRVVNPSPSDTALYSVHVFDAENAIVVGDTGTIKRTTDGGISWRTIPSGTKVRLSKVRFLNPSIGFIAGGNPDGNQPLLLKTTDGGETWREIDTKGNRVFFDVWFHSEDTGFVVGQHGIMRATMDGGKTWASIDAGFNENNIFSIHFPSRRIGYICGNAGSVAKTTTGGTSWHKQSSWKNNALFSVSFANDSVGIIAGDGVILGTTNGGKEWEARFADFPITSPLMHAVHVDPSTAYIVGWFGYIIASRDSGKSWQLQEWGGSSLLEELGFYGKRVGYAVGWEGTILKTMDGGGLVAREVDPAPFAINLRALYPNPLSLGTHRSVRVEFSLSSSGNAAVDLLDVLGRPVRRIAAQRFSQGTHIVPWEPSELPPGVYRLRLSSASHSIVRPLVVVR